MATEYTPNYNLDLYGSADSANLRDQYNAAMGKIDGELLNLNNSDITFNNLIANINREIETINNSVDQANTYIGQLQALTGDQGDLIKANKDAIAGLQSTVNTHSDHLTTIDGEIGTLTSDSQALTATVEAHGTAITDVQKTADDALSLAQTNEADIAVNNGEIAKNIQAIYADSIVNGWDIIHSNGSPLLTSDSYVMVNKGRGVIKFTGRATFDPSSPVTGTNIPGTVFNGIRIIDNLMQKIGITNPTEPIVYGGAGFYLQFNSQNVATNMAPFAIIIGTDGSLYIPFPNGSTVPTTRIICIFMQLPLSLVNLNFEYHPIED